MGYLGLGPTPGASRPLSPARPNVSRTSKWHGEDGETLIATAGMATLWLTGNETAQWIEIRGQFPTLRATRPKASLMVNARIDIERWADGGTPEAKARDLVIATGRYNGLRVLILRYRTWKPLRLTREQAKAFLNFLDPIRSFVNAQRAT